MIERGLALPGSMAALVTQMWPEIAWHEMRSKRISRAKLLKRCFSFVVELRQRQLRECQRKHAGAGVTTPLGFDLLSRFSARPQTKCNRAAISAPAYRQRRRWTMCQWQLLLRGLLQQSLLGPIASCRARWACKQRVSEWMGVVTLTARSSSLDAVLFLGCWMHWAIWQNDKHIAGGRAGGVLCGLCCLHCNHFDIYAYQAKDETTVSSSLLAPYLSVSFSLSLSLPCCPASGPFKCGIFNDVQISKFIRFFFLYFYAGLISISF